MKVYIGANEFDINKIGDFIELTDEMVNDLGQVFTSFNEECTVVFERVDDSHIFKVVNLTSSIFPVAEVEGKAIEDMTKKELLEVADARGFDVKSSMKKADILDMINERV